MILYANKPKVNRKFEYFNMMTSHSKAQLGDLDQSSGHSHDIGVCSEQTKRAKRAKGLIIALIILNAKKPKVNRKF